MKVAVIVQLAILTLVKAHSDVFTYTISPSTVYITSCCELKRFPAPPYITVPSYGFQPQTYVHTISQGSFSTANVYCDMKTDNGGWIVIQRNRNNSGTNFNRNWKEYEEGFGNLGGDFWAGLKLIHALTHSGQWEMRVDYQKGHGNNNWEYLHYDHFRVESAYYEYRLSVSGYTGEASFDPFTGDGPVVVNGMNFSTFDNDNDLSKYKNCADFLNCGWWYRHCYVFNINHQPPSYTHQRQNVALHAEMKIRPKDCIV